MNLVLKKYPALCRLAGVLFVAAILWSIGLVATAVTLVFAFQLWELSNSKRRGFCFVSSFTPEQVKEFEQIMGKLKELGESVPDILAMVKEYPDMKGALKKLRLGMAGAGMGGGQVRWVGNQAFVSEDCARALTSVLVLDCAKADGRALETLVKDATIRQNVLSLAKSTLGFETRAALTGTDIPLPTIFVPQIVELVFAYGAARQYATVMPLGPAGQVKLPRLKAGEDDFGYLGNGTLGGISQNIPEKKVTAELIAFDANKFGGLIRIPFELQEGTFVPIGQFLARYIARQLAKGEDKTMFLADGTNTYAGQTGVGPYCVANPTYLLQLGAGKTAMTDITLDDLRNMRGKVSPAVLANMAANGQTDAAYYFHPSMEPLLRSFNKYPNFVVFTNENGKPMFDGWPVRWIGVGTANDGQAHPSGFAGFFGALSYWYLGEADAVRVEISKEVFFATDELAMRALERIDVNGMAVDAMATLQLAAA